MTMTISRIGVVGSGTMGNGIAQTCAMAGLDVVMMDISEEQVQRGLATIVASLDRLIKRERMNEADKEAVLGRITTVTSLAAFADCDLAIEAASENADVKLKIFAELDAILGPDAIIASNTSSISITRLAAGTKRPGQVIGMHFFNPVPVMGLIEVVGGLQTSAATAATVETLAIAVDAKDQVTHGHIRRVQRHTIAVARALGVTDELELRALEAASLLHDVGKLAVPDYVLNKPGALTHSEFERMKLHAAKGAEILQTVDFPYAVVPIVRHHHEQWNGEGYPAGVAGEAIPLAGRLVMVADVYDALTSDRVYREAWPPEKVLAYIREYAGRRFDPRIAAVCERPDVRRLLLAIRKRAAA